MGSYENRVSRGEMTSREQEEYDDKWKIEDCFLYATDWRPVVRDADDSVFLQTGEYPHKTFDGHFMVFDTSLDEDSLPLLQRFCDALNEKNHRERGSNPEKSDGEVV